MMAQDFRIDEIFDIFNKFNFDSLNDDWITNVIDSDFTEVESLPLDFEELHNATNFTGLFQAQISTLRLWVDTLPVENRSDERNLTVASLNVSQDRSYAEEEKNEGVNIFWSDFSKKVKVKGMMSLICYYVHLGQKFDAKQEDRELACQAACLYFLILCIPGSNAFRVFHPVLYLKSLDLLKLAIKLNVAQSSPKKGKSSAAQKGASSRRETVPEDDDDNDAEFTFLTPQETNHLIRLLNVLLSDFIRLSQKFSLKHSPESLDETVSVLTDLTQCERQNAQSVFLGNHGTSTVTSLAYNAYVALQCMCSELHGKPRKIIILVLKHILPNILMTSRGTSELALRALGVIRDHSVIFVKYLMTQLNEVTHDGVYILVQQMCLRVPDKADYRQKTSQSIMEIMKHLPVTLYTKLLEWLLVLSHNEKAGHRLFVLEIVSKMLSEDEREPGEAPPPVEMRDNSAATDPDETVSSSFNVVTLNHPKAPDREVLSHKFLLSIIFSRCRDSAATVRSKALSLLAESTLSDNPTIIRTMQDIFSQKEPEVFTTPHVSHIGVNIESPLEMLNKEQEGEGSRITMPNADMVLKLLWRRAVDAKVTVRKSALQVLENLLKLDKKMVTKENLEVLCDHCRDPALLIRKQMVVTLSSLVKMYPLPLVAEYWVRGVMPTILDPEMKVQEKVVEMVNDVVLSRLMPSNHRDSEDENKMSWMLLSVTAKLSHQKFLNKVVFAWGKSPMAKSEVIEVTKSHINGTFNEEAWMLMSVLSHSLDLKNAQFAVDYYIQNCHKIDEIGWYTLQNVLKVLCNCVQSISVKGCEELQPCLLKPLQNASVNTSLVPAIIDLLTLVTLKLNSKENFAGEKAVAEWAEGLISTSDQHLQKVIFSSDSQPLPPEEEELLFRRIFLVGEAGLLCPKGINKRMFLMLQSVIFHEEDGREGVVSPPAIPSTQTQSTQPLRVNYVPPKRIKAVCVVVLGKLCLQHENQAKRIIPALGRLLDNDPGPDIKTNIVITLSDMCVRYATVVEPLMPQMTSCLRDSNLQVRRTTLTLLISLLQEDYLKLRGSFFYRILQCLCDKEEDMRNTVVFFFTERLLKRFPKVFSQHFIECVFHYNGYEGHESFNRFSQNESEKELFSLAGETHSEERMSLYKFMLEHMSDDQRFGLTNRLCHDVLGEVVEDRLPNSEAVLRDSLLVLSCEEIKLASLKARPEDDQATSKEEEEALVGMAVKKTIISQVVKRAVIENIVPILISLKHKLEKQRSPLMKHLLLYLKEIMKDYKNEVKEILAGDKQLAEEIEFDLRKLEEKQKEEEERKRMEADRIQEEMRQRKEDARTPASETSFSGNLDLPSKEVQSPQSLPRSIINSAIKNLTPTKSNSEKANLLKTAVLNSRKIGEKTRKSTGAPCITNDCDEEMERSDLSSSRTSKRRVTIAGCSISRKEINEEVAATSNKTDENTEAVKKNIGENTEGKNEKVGENTEGVKGKSNPLNKSNDERNSYSETLIEKNDDLRQISTPNKTLMLNNITFVNQTQEMSIIDGNRTGNCSQHSVLLHLANPNDYAKSDEFSRMKRSTKRSLNPQFRSEKKNDVPNDVGGESSDDSVEKSAVSGLFGNSTEDNTADSGSELLPKQKVSKNTSGKRKKKRNRIVAELSPDIRVNRQKNKKNRNTEE